MKHTTAPLQRETVESVGTRVVYADGHAEISRARLLREHTLDLVVNLRHLARLICTGEELRCLAAGFLYTERIIDSVEEIEGFYLCPDGYTARIFLTKQLEAMDATRTDKSCCTKNRLLLDVAGKRPLRLVEDRSGWTDADIFRLAARFRERMPLHTETESTHCCFLLYQGKIVFACEDIGRHNALDKAVGFALQNGIPLPECVAYTSGRVPVDMAEKAVAAFLPVLVSKATPTVESVALAQEYGLTLICRAWEDRYEMVSSGRTVSVGLLPQNMCGTASEECRRTK